ncbi:PAS domain S-box protein [Pedobacter aquatilis]|uniref:PAS domain S-box protein n=1 Tax=Pedobacter aquatilis TaxID=351343 RepID=UPI00292FA583|nr:PAS domain S-box protein [Pedobacter aquatilis]
MLKDIYRQLFCKSAEAAMLVEVGQNGNHVIEVTDYYLKLARIEKKDFLETSSTNFLSGITSDKKTSQIIADGIAHASATHKQVQALVYSEHLKKTLGLNIKPMDVESVNTPYFILTIDDTNQDGQDLSDDSALNLQRFNHLIQNGLNMISVLDDNGNYLYVSNSSQPVLGFGSDYYNGRNTFEFFHPDDIDEAKKSLQNINGKSSVVLKPFRFKHKNGSWRWIETTLTDLRNEPSVKGIIANSRDITEQINIQNDILLSNERYNYVTRATSEAIWDWDLVSGSLIWGEGFNKLFGYSENELNTIIDTWFEKIYPDDLNRVNSSIHKVLENKESNWFDEYRLRKADGSYAFVADKGFVIFDKSGHPVRMVGALQDITKMKQEEQRLKLLESVVLNTTDSVAIMEVNPEKFPISEIVYVNEAFCRMAGYTYSEIIGQSPRLLEGPRTDQEELNRLVIDLLKGLPGEATLINYKKNGDEFWLNLSVTPIADDKGNFNRWISIQRDITQQKIETIRQNLLSGISLLFNRFSDMKRTTALVLDEISRCGNFCTAELWLPDANDRHVKLFARSKADELMEHFYVETANFGTAKKGEGLAGRVWRDMKPEDTSLTGDIVEGIRIPAAIKAGLKHIYGLPLIYNGKLTGILILAVRQHHKLEGMAILSENFSEFLAGEVKRKLLEQELGEVFEFAPDILATLDYKGYFKRINPAAADLLGYSEAELLQKPAKYFVHPLDRLSTARKIKKLTDGDKALSFENRYITKSGQVKWLSWTANAVSADGLIFAVAKDITEKKMLADLLQKTNSLARIGSWEVNVADKAVFWSDVTKEIREADPDFKPDLETGIHYFKDGRDKDTIKAKVEACMLYGTPWDEELEIETFKGNSKWIRTIGQAEMVGGKCVRIFGSFQDIDARKRAELLNKKILREVAESEKRYSELFHFSPLPMWVYDSETLCFLDVNLAAINHYGFSREEFLSMTIRDIRPEEEIPVLENTIEEIKKGNSFYTRGIYKHKLKDGTVIRADVRSNPMLFKGRKAKLIVSADITKELLHINAIEEKNAKLEEIAWIQSHTVRAPLARIMGLVDILSNNREQKVMSQSDIISHIESSAEELDVIIKEITAKSDKTK